MDKYELKFTNGEKYTAFCCEANGKEYCYAIFDEIAKCYRYTKDVPHLAKWMLGQWNIKIKLYPKGTFEKLGV